MKVPEIPLGSGRFRAVPVQMPGQGSAGGGLGGGRSASPKGEQPITTPGGGASGGLGATALPAMSRKSCS